ncbi:FecR family protein [Dyadobacter bucti]|uniref:FecR family protein n=1 Tax=Dyadobacter bucti TaxID=2572203 RepID=UPI00110815E0|nr:FecR family protein [Dyadobacter bucti]
MNDRFAYLLKRYLDKLATGEELEELRSLIRTNEFEDIVKSDIADYLMADFKDPETGREHQADVLYDRILNEVREPFVKVETGWKRRWMWAAAAVLTGIGVVIWNSGKWKKEIAKNVQVAATDSLLTFSNKDFIHLPDGSTVLLNEGSVLSYHASYGTSLREVSLSGEAFFDIKKDPGHAFIVHTGNVITKVLGTAFNIDARQKKIVVTVTRGLVEVGDKNKTYGRIKPDEQITVNTANNQFKLAEVNALSELKWKNESLIFDEITVEESAKMIEERYNVKVNFENNDIKKCRISAWFLNGEDLDHVLEMVSGTRQASYVVKGDQVNIIGGFGCE